MYLFCILTTLMLISLQSFCLGLPQNLNVKVHCETDARCHKVMGIFGQCVKHECVCPPTANCMIMLDQELPVNILGEECQNNSQCRVNGSECQDRQCLCKVPLLPSTNKRKCFEVSDLHSACEDQLQCDVIGLAVCNNSVCVCEAGAHEIGKKCWKTLGLGDKCVANEECSQVKGSVCSQTCTCDKEFVISENKSTCLQTIKSVTSPCSEDIQCITFLGSNSACKENACVCNDNYRLNSTTQSCECESDGGAGQIKNGIASWILVVASLLFIA